MCKRFIAIPLLCLVVIMAACPFSVYAVDPSSPSFPYPENNVSGSFTVNFASTNATGVMCQGSASYNFGDLWTGKFLTLDPSDDPSGNHGPMGYGLRLTSQINLSITVGGDLYLALPYHIDESYLSSGPLSSFRSVSGDYNVDFGDDWPVNTYTPVPSSLTFASGTGTGSVYITFVCYRNVPAGEYTLTYDFVDSSIPICFGVYANNLPSMNGYVDSLVNGIINGEIDYPDSAGYIGIMSQLREIQQSQSSDNVDLSILRELEFQSAVMYLHDQLDALFAGILSAFPSTFQEFHIEYFSGIVDEIAFFTLYTQLLSEGISICSSSEQLAFMSSYFDFEFSRFEFLSRLKAKENLEDAISSGDVAQIQQYYDAEQELISAFDQARFQAQLDFDTWFNLLPPDETIEYKKIYDYILNDSPIKNYIMIPVSMGLVTILLGTGIRFVGSKRGENND